MKINSKEEAAYIAEVLKKYSEGAEVEYRSDNDASWSILNNPLFDDECVYHYRVKLEPKLRPYKSVEEFLKAQKEHGLYVVYTETKTYWLSDRITDDGVYINDCKYTFNILFKKFTWQDGTPCGIKLKIKNN